MSEEPGPTGKFPDGKLNDDDEGELNIAVHADNGMVRVDFGTKLEWISMTPDDAADLARILVRMATVASMRG
jgi:hypothetical protein